MLGMTLSKGSPLPFEQNELGPDGRPIIGLFYFEWGINCILKNISKKGQNSSYLFLIIKFLSY